MSTMYQVITQVYIHVICTSSVVRALYHGFRIGRSVIIGRLRTPGSYKCLSLKLDSLLKVRPREPVSQYLQRTEDTTVCLVTEFTTALRQQSNLKLSNCCLVLRLRGLGIIHAMIIMRIVLIRICHSLVAADREVHMAVRPGIK